jgi:hypothetical protein
VRDIGNDPVSREQLLRGTMPERILEKAGFTAIRAANFKRLS